MNEAEQEHGDHRRDERTTNTHNPWTGPNKVESQDPECDRVMYDRAPDVAAYRLPKRMGVRESTPMVHGLRGPGKQLTLVAAIEYSCRLPSGPFS